MQALQQYQLTNQSSQSLLNNRYQKVKRLGEGSYGTVFLAIDTKPEGLKRKVEKKVLNLLDRVEDQGATATRKYSDYEMHDQTQEPPTEEFKEAINVLGNKNLIFNQNEIFEQTENNQIAANATKEDGESQSKEKGAQLTTYVAIKKVKMNSFNERNGIPFTALREIKLLQELNHPNVIKLYDVFYVHKIIFLALEYLPHDLSNLIRDNKIMLKDEHVKNILLQVLQGLEYLHSNFLMHRDLSPSNLMISEQGVIKLIDFGLAKPYGTPERMHTTGVITRAYRPPEVLFGARFYGPMVDIWSLGCILGELLIRAPLFPGTTDIDQLGKIFTVRGTPTLEDWPDVDQLQNYLEFTIKDQKPLNEIFPFASENCLDLLEKMLQLNPNKRITAKDALNHPYFTEEAPAACKNEDLPLPIMK